mmetsp:Transcript_9196/g.27687  ORF Transcript_9196/g.27687 Transcript_9196/m.27687 type:complete len:952 (-) Transcript_9196:81-2936(-)|eukprot:CAMPEP_0198735842 /NCGR_PEP_ID=MMETSP1475-20131203/62006_1 /TAXON_ID= ORGANISM="Unidentified sp., Strain CCMP1999" /NCGR_SAMPLE_ID=MMETSP1475 /ASSEMBLY_ACC=CAM_ASM_001111 /LENGTH=951 /DNA_ID=CAMNT_0044499565 /DNA_START=101 /DNA_END=2956 /DNA_ORIENTATION=+
MESRGKRSRLSKRNGAGNGTSVVFCSRAWQGKKASEDADTDLADDIMSYIREMHLSYERDMASLPVRSAENILPQMFREVYTNRGGYSKVTTDNAWNDVRSALKLPKRQMTMASQLSRVYKKVLLSYERERRALEARSDEPPPVDDKLIGYSLKLRFSDRLGRKYSYRWGVVVGYDAEDGEHDVLMDDEFLLRVRLEDLETQIGSKDPGFPTPKFVPAVLPQLSPVENEPVELDPAALDLAYHQILSQGKRKRYTVDPNDSIGDYNRPLFDTNVYMTSWSEPGKRAKRKLLDAKDRVLAGQSVNSKIVKCACGINKVVGSMIECNLCHCFSHTFCLNIDDKEAETYKGEYRCFLCTSKGLKTESLAYHVASAIEQVRLADKWSDVPSRIRRSANLPIKKYAMYRGDLAEESAALQDKKFSEIASRDRTANDEADAEGENDIEADAEEEDRFVSAFRDYLLRCDLKLEPEFEKNLTPEMFFRFSFNISKHGGSFRELTEDQCQTIFRCIFGKDENPAEAKSKLGILYEKYLAGFFAELDETRKTENDISDGKDEDKADSVREESPVVMMDAVVAVDSKICEDIAETQSKDLQKEFETVPEKDAETRDAEQLVQKQEDAANIGEGAEAAETPAKDANDSQEISANEISTKNIRPATSAAEEEDRGDGDGAGSEEHEKSPKSVTGAGEPSHTETAATSQEDVKFQEKSGRTNDRMEGVVHNVGDHSGNEDKATEDEDMKESAAEKDAANTQEVSTNQPELKERDPEDRHAEMREAVAAGSDRERWEPVKSDYDAMVGQSKSLVAPHQSDENVKELKSNGEKNRDSDDAHDSSTQAREVGSHEKTAAAKDVEEQPLKGRDGHGTSANEIRKDDTVNVHTDPPKEPRCADDIPDKEHSRNDEGQEAEAPEKTGEKSSPIKQPKEPDRSQPPTPEKGADKESGEESEEGELVEAPTT